MDITIVKTSREDDCRTHPPVHILRAQGDG